MKIKLLLAALLLSVTSLCAKDLQTIVFTPNPPMSCQNCENKIKGNLRFEKGVKDIRTDLKAQEITITYDADKTTPEKLVTALDKIGYEATPVVCDPTTEEACTKAAGACCGGAKAEQGCETPTPDCCKK
ncbi:MAG: heavy-metal-associated domain-containing protein [Muribaculaceae bacterium]|nr:heavy-metal-associated domain-containing protein [Muribaculaceae bacterium]